MRITIKIIITKNQRLKISVTDEQGNQTLLKLTENCKEEIIPSITFDKNVIRLYQEEENTIHFMKNGLKNQMIFQHI